jgi:hypothetical protein
MQSAKRVRFSPITIAMLIAFAAPVAFVAFYPLRPKATIQNQSAAVGYIRALNKLEADYARKHRDQGFACNLKDLPAAAVGVPGASNEKFSGYKFAMQNCGANKGPVTHYQIYAVPTDSKSKLSAVCTDESGNIWLGAEGSKEACFKKTKQAPTPTRED